ncbi:MAG: LUD domain-containing protein [Deltaproteobacteria bacterium]|nr:LUD domain-containing protein [Deltaproteobacteria bacterium]
MNPIKIAATSPTAGTPVSLSAVRAACHRALTARDRRLEEYPHWEAWRRQAREIKAAAISRLDELLGQLAREVEAWGGQVLWARDAAEARGLILRLAREHQVTLVTKSKSMTSEEIGLNPALAAAGVRTWETDLGEFIVQLAGQPPAHLTAPALHLDRRQIAAIFEDHLGGPCSPEPETLARRATEYLRSRFWEAGMGITGVNFATPDGTLVFLENESNLRLTATLPKVQVAVMGLEKLIPSLADLEVLLRLLPASATGQRLTALVHFIKGRKFQPGGPQAFYLIILDNGRRQLSRDPDLREALYCLRCGACLNICPVFQLRAAHLYGRVYPGAIGILLAPHLNPPGDLSDLCTQCGACQEICPVQINLAEKILLTRSRSSRYRGLKLISGIAGRVLARPRLYRGLEPALRLLQAGSSRRFPGLTLASESFHRARKAPQAGKPAEPPSPVDLTGHDFSGQTAEAAFNPGEVAPASRPTLALEASLAEVDAVFHRLQGPVELGHWLARLGEPIWLQDHPWLRLAAGELANQGLKPRLASTAWGPEGETAVIIGLGAIPETGSVLIEAAAGPVAALSFRMRRLAVIVPEGQAGLSLAQALKLTARRAPMVTWLTGPSRTADIEKTLVLGAHGPEELHVVIYRED